MRLLNLLFTLLLFIVLSTAVQVHQDNLSVVLSTTAMREDITKANTNLLTTVREEIWAVNQIQLAAFAENHARAMRERIGEAAGAIEVSPAPLLVAGSLKYNCGFFCRHPVAIVMLFNTGFQLVFVGYIFARLVRQQQHRRRRRLSRRPSLQ